MLQTDRQTDRRFAVASPYYCIASVGKTVRVIHFEIVFTENRKFQCFGHLRFSVVAI